MTDWKGRPKSALEDTTMERENKKQPSVLAVEYLVADTVVPRFHLPHFNTLISFQVLFYFLFPPSVCFATNMTGLISPAYFLSLMPLSPVRAENLVHALFWLGASTLCQPATVALVQSLSWSLLV